MYFFLIVFSIIVLLPPAVLNEDFELFELVITIPAGTGLDEPVCVDSQQLGIVDDQIVEDTQYFFLDFQETSLLDTDVSGVFEVYIEDNDCEFLYYL